LAAGVLIMSDPLEFAPLPVVLAAGGAVGEEVASTREGGHCPLRASGGAIGPDM
jgi:hypothetical protein